LHLLCQKPHHSIERESKYSMWSFWLVSTVRESKKGRTLLRFTDLCHPELCSERMVQRTLPMQRDTREG
jgi:hypothetical protein